MLLHIFLMQLDRMYLGADLMKCYISAACVNVIYKHGSVFLWNLLQLIFCIFFLPKIVEIGFWVGGWVLAIESKHFGDFLQIS